jgi:hypothetical protein
VAVPATADKLTVIGTVKDAPGVVVVQVPSDTLPVWQAQLDMTTLMPCRVRPLVADRPTSSPNCVVWYASE